MDNSSLTTIAVTAVISVIAKEVLTWAVAWVKTIAMAQTTRARLKAIFNSTSLRIIWDLATVVMYTGIIVWIGWIDEPLSGKALLIVVGAVFCDMVCIISLLVDIHRALAQRDAARSREGAP